MLLNPTTAANQIDAIIFDEVYFAKHHHNNVSILNICLVSLSLWVCVFYHLHCFSSHRRCMEVARSHHVERLKGLIFFQLIVLFSLALRQSKQQNHPVIWFCYYPKSGSEIWRFSTKVEAEPFVKRSTNCRWTESSNNIAFVNMMNSQQKALLKAAKTSKPKGMEDGTSTIKASN